jgi:hypothetical protein
MNLSTRLSYHHLQIEHAILHNAEEGHVSLVELDRSMRNFGRRSSQGLVTETYPIHLLVQRNLSANWGKRG